MLVLTRKEMEDILIRHNDLIPMIKNDPEGLAKILAEPVIVRNVGVRGDKVRLGVEANRGIRVNRREVDERE
jgi:sRNA-binding carbon storage regulator CsrA